MMGELRKTECRLATLETQSFLQACVLTRWNSPQISQICRDCISRIGETVSPKKKQYSKCLHINFGDFSGRIPPTELIADLATTVDHVSSAPQSKPRYIVAMYYRVPPKYLKG